MVKLKSLGALIDFAIAQEIETFDLYQRLAEKATNGKSRDILLGFATDEMSHKRHLESVKSRTDPNVLNKAAPALEVDFQVSFPPASPDMTFHEVLTFAIQCEKDTSDLYSRMADSTLFAPLKTVCLALAKEEEKHQHRLETLYKETD